MIYSDGISLIATHACPKCNEAMQDASAAGYMLCPTCHHKEPSTDHYAGREVSPLAIVAFLFIAALFAIASIGAKLAGL